MEVRDAFDVINLCDHDMKPAGNLPSAQNEVGVV